MPLYEYICQDCGQVSEALRKMDDADTAIACQHCDSSRTRRAQSVFAASTGRQASGQMGQMPQMPACGRCGDPRGSCSA